VLPNLLHLFARRAGPGYEQEFVREVKVRSRPPRSRKLELIIAVCWVLIALKTAFVLWAVPHYHIPFSPLWVIVPTLIFATVCTAIYVVRRW
jgi:hypothetical protein